jgi:ankyrin repeat protein
LLWRLERQNFDQDNLPEIDNMVSVCAGLVTVDEESNIIRLVHYTAQEYFKRIRASWIPNAEDDITIACVTYLAFNVFAVGPSLTDEEFFGALQQVHVLYKYAARNWGYHARAASTKVQESILFFLDREAQVASCSRIEIEMSFDFFYRWGPPKQITALHLVACSGLAEVITLLLANGHCPDPEDSHGRTPLCWAAQLGNEAVIELLLAQDGVDPNSKDIENRTPLAWAAAAGHEAVVKLLIADDRVNVNSKDQNGRTPMEFAAEEGKEAVVTLLLKKDGIDINSKDYRGSTLLAKTRHPDIIKLLLTKDGIDLNSKDGDAQTALSSAAMNEDEVVVKLLLARDGIDLNSKNMTGQTPLLVAAMNGD